VKQAKKKKGVKMTEVQLIARLSLLESRGF